MKKNYFSVYIYILTTIYCMIDAIYNKNSVWAFYILKEFIK